MSIKSAVVAIMSTGMIFLSTLNTAAETPAASAVVQGPENHLYEFNKNLMGIVGSNFDNVGINCGECGGLRYASTTTRTVTYVIYRDTKRLNAFVEAWNKLQTSHPDPFVTLQFGMEFTRSDCSTQPPPCVSAPYCATKCDQNNTPPCTACR